MILMMKMMIMICFLDFKGPLTRSAPGGLINYDNDDDNDDDDDDDDDDYNNHDDDDDMFPKSFFVGL